ncbi:folate receptor beta-like [Anneissia japonica]|uniref:folate receptor beta-like n=1 Tax=Anneissia japonica TaxID=1529436 RepID=UPI001425B47A|nr:folate receptor beta-like [Anneissia japonica]
MKKFVCQCALMGELYVMDLALWLIFFSTVTMTSSEDSVEAYLNRCLDGVNHKTKPGPESNLFGQCNQYKELSCCTEETTRGLHQSHSWLNFNWHHCDTQLSKACTAFLNHDLCFYECSPNVAPWLVPHNISIRNERYKGIPLCESECNAWWDACRYDLTCKDNWALGWDWSAGVNVCPAGTTCRTFEDVFGSAANMCHQIWAGAFNVTADNEQCMVFYFSDTNPNREVARYYAERMLKESSIATNSAVELSSSIFIFLFSLIVYILHHYHLCYHVVSRTEL